jgi:hypothetical protein
LIPGIEKSIQSNESANAVSDQICFTVAFHVSLSFHFKRQVRIGIETEDTENKNDNNRRSDASENRIPWGQLFLFNSDDSKGLG